MSNTVIFLRVFFTWTIFFLSLYWICYNIASILCFLAMRHYGIILTNRSKDRTHMPCIGRWSLRHWTAREIPTLSVCKRLKSWCYVISFQQYVPSSPWLHVEIFQRGFKSNDGWGPHSGNLILLSCECGLSIMHLKISPCDSTLQANENQYFRQ